MITKLDRLTRVVGDWSALIKEFFYDEKRKKLFSVNDQVDTRTPNGRFFLNMMISIAEWERDTIGGRTSDALQQKIRRRERCGKLRFGYDLADDGKTLIENRAEQAAIGLMKGWRDEEPRRTYRDIAALLRAEGIPTKEGGIWRPATIRQILRRPVA